MPSFNTDQCKEGGAGDWVDKPCRCQFLIREVDEDFAGAAKPEYRLELEVVASSEPDQVGKFMHKDKGGRVFISGGGVGKLFELGCATGILNRQYLKQQLDAKAPVDFEPKEMEGRTFITDVTFRPGKDNPEKKFANIGGESGFQFFALGDEEVDSFPKDEHYTSYARQEGTGMLLTRNSEWRKPGAPKAGAGTQPAGGGSNGNGSKPANAPPKNSPPAGRTSTPPRQTVPADDIPF